MVPEKERTGPLLGRPLGAGLAVVFSVVATLYAFAMFGASVRRVEHTLLVKQSAQDWLVQVLDAEAAQRAYLVSPKDEFLDPYRDALARAHEEAERLRAMTGDNEQQEMRIEVAETAAVACINGMRDTLGLIQAGERDAAVLSIASGASKTRLDGFRHAIGVFQAEEDRLLLERARSEQVRGIVALVAVGTFSAVAVYLLFITRALGRAAEAAARAAHSAGVAAAAERTAALEKAKTQRFHESFIAVLGHDLRNPLNSISMATQLLLRKNLPPDVVAPLNRAKTACERMLRMIEQILDFTRSRLAGGIPLDPRDMDLEALVREVVDESRLAHPEREIDLATEGDLHGRWDGDRLAQVVSNLVGNAITHGVGGNPVHVSARATSGHVEMTVVNSGEIPNAVRENLFDPFRRASSQTKSAGSAGLGLGLFIAEQIVRQHGGELLATAAEGKTSFVVQLPRDSKNPRRAAPSPSPS
jgi:signal transduction histidine kinase